MEPKRSKVRASHAGGRRFESCRAHHRINNLHPQITKTALNPDGSGRSLLTRAANEMHYPYLSALSRGTTEEDLIARPAADASLNDCR